MEQRHYYLRRMMTNRQENRPVVYLDETWANAHDGRDCAWVERDDVTGGTLGGIKRPPGKGARLIILGAGGENGWIPNTTLIFRSKKNTGDYHDEMTADHFEEWFGTKLLPNVPPNSLIVMDNASYHSRRSDPVPVKSWTKQKMQDWLQAKGVEFPTNALKAELYSIIQRMKPTPRYVVDDMAAAAGKNLVKIAFVFIDMYIIQGMRWSDSLLLTALSILLSWHGHRLKVTSRPTLVHLTSVRLSSWHGRVSML